MLDCADILRWKCHFGHRSCNKWNNENSNSTIAHQSSIPMESRRLDTGLLSDIRISSLLSDVLGGPLKLLGCSLLLVGVVRMRAASTLESEWNVIWTFFFDQLDCLHYPLQIYIEYHETIDGIICIARHISTRLGCTVSIAFGKLKIRAHYERRWGMADEFILIFNNSIFVQCTHSQHIKSN